MTGQRAHNSDAAVGADLLDTDTTLPAAGQADLAVEGIGAGTRMRMQALGDSAYGSGETLAALGKPGPTR